MKYRFWANLQACFQLDDRTFGLLFKCMRHHYDGSVKAATEQGGFMYGSRNRRRPGGSTDLEYRNGLELSSRELQLLMKALEMRQYVVGDELDQLDTDLHRLWHVLAEQHRQLNEGQLAAGGTV